MNAEHIIEIDCLVLIELHTVRITFTRLTDSNACAIVLTLVENYSAAVNRMNVNCVKVFLFFWCTVTALTAFTCNTILMLMLCL